MIIKHSKSEEWSLFLPHLLPSKSSRLNCLVKYKARFYVKYTMLILHFISGFNNLFMCKHLRNHHRSQYSSRKVSVFQMWYSNKKTPAKIAYTLIFYRILVSHRWFVCRAIGLCAVQQENRFCMVFTVLSALLVAPDTNSCLYTHARCMNGAGHWQ